MPTFGLTLVSFDLCPYVQRAAIALAEKGVPFERRTVDLANRPDWFKAISPLGKEMQAANAEIIFESTDAAEMQRLLAKSGAMIGGLK